MTDREPLTYAAAGVDVAAGERAVAMMRAAVEATHDGRVLGGIGGFAGLWSLDPARFADPVLVAAADGVGTKLLVAQALDRHDTIGVDLVAMVVDGKRTLYPGAFGQARPAGQSERLCKWARRNPGRYEGTRGRLSSPRSRGACRRPGTSCSECRTCSTFACSAPDPRGSSSRTRTHS